MTNLEIQVADFFQNYPDAPCVHEVASQLFHDNAKEAAQARADFYGLEVNTIYSPKFSEGGFSAGMEILAETPKTEGETEVPKVETKDKPPRKKKAA